MIVNFGTIIIPAFHCVLVLSTHVTFPLKLRMAKLTKHNNQYVTETLLTAAVFILSFKSLLFPAFIIVLCYSI